MNEQLIIERIEVITEYLLKNESLFLNIYDKNGNLVKTNNDRTFYNIIFEKTDAKDEIISNLKNTKYPIIFSSQNGLIWIALKVIINEEEHYYCYGPTTFFSVSYSGLDKVIMDRYDLEIENKRKIINLLDKIPIVQLSNIYKILSTLYYALYKETLDTASILFIDKNLDKQDEKKRESLYFTNTYNNEKEFQENIKCGNIDYRMTSKANTSLSFPFNNIFEDKLLNTIANSIMLVTLSRNAAIEGGLSIEVANDIASKYIYKIKNSKDKLQITMHTSEMYNTFVNAVHNNRLNKLSISREIKKCIDYIDLNIDKKINIDTLANEIAYSKYYLSKKFEKEMHTSINNYIKLRKIEKAKILLSTTTMTIDEIYVSLSFSSRSFFQETFKDITGISPKQYRKNNYR